MLPERQRTPGRSAQPAGVDPGPAQAPRDRLLDERGVDVLDARVERVAGGQQALQLLGAASLGADKGLGAGDVTAQLGVLRVELAQLGVGGVGWPGGPTARSTRRTRGSRSGAAFWR